MVSLRCNFDNTKKERIINYIVKNRIKTKPLPPTYRYCIICKGNTWFKYDYSAGHSYCMVCANYRSGTQPQ